MTDVDLEAAIEAVVALAPEPVTERVAAADALGRTLSGDLSARLDHPSRDQAAMDGYACREADAADASPERPARLRRVGEAAAGVPFRGRVGPGEAVAVATGADFPDGCDALALLERTRREGDVVWLDAPADPKHVRRRGEDLRRDRAYLHAGERLDPARLAVAAALGHDRLPVARSPRVAVLATGAELVSPGSAARPGQVYDANAAALAAVLRAAGAEPVALSRIGDEEDALRRSLAGAEACALRVSTGGASVGRFDAVRAVLEREADLRFRRVRVRPGGPTLLGVLDGVPLLALPGTPVAAFLMGFALLGAWCHAALGRAGPPPILDRQWALSDGPVRGVPAKTALWLARTRIDDAGVRRVRVLERQGSARVAGLLAADALVVMPPGPGVEDGVPVALVPLGLTPPPGAP